MGFSLDYADLCCKEKNDIQKKWQKNEVLVLYAVIAFSIENFKANVQFTIDHTLPRFLGEFLCIQVMNPSALLL